MPWVVVNKTQCNARLRDHSSLKQKRSSLFSRYFHKIIQEKRKKALLTGFVAMFRLSSSIQFSTVSGNLEEFVSHIQEIILLVQAKWVFFE